MYYNINIKTMKVEWQRSGTVTPIIVGKVDRSLKGKKGNLNKMYHVKFKKINE